MSDDIRTVLYLAEQTDFWAGHLWHGRAVLVAGEVVPSEMAAACAALQRRHAALRRRFDDIGGRPVLVAAAECPVELVVGAPSSLATALAAGASPRFDLDARPGIQVGVHPVDDGRTLVTLTLHAAVGGRLAASRLLEELGERYSSGAANPPPASAPPSAAVPTSVESAPSVEASASPAIAWPAARARSHGGVITTGWALSPGEAARLRRFAGHLGITPAAVLRCALRVLLFRETGEGDVPIGSPRRTGDAGVAPEEIDVFRQRIGASASVADTLRAENAAAPQPADPAEVLHALLSRPLRPERHAGFEVQAGFRCAAVAERPGGWAGLEARDVDRPAAYAPYEIELDVTVDGDRIAGVWRGAVGLFDEDTLERMGRSYSTLLLGLLQSPDCPIGELDVIHAADRARLTAWETPTPPVSGEDTVVELTDRWIRETPGEPAVVMAGAVHTYRELDDAAGRIAAGLDALRLPAESPVAILVSRRVELPAILLGVARAGLAAVPMDPGHPAERLAYIAADSGCGAVITDDALPIDRVAVLGVPVVSLYDLLAAPPAPAGRPPHPDALAYVLYTSGSTGRPKGVAVTHRGLANCVVATRELLGFRPGQSLLAVTTISFDIAMLELFLAPASGGQTILASSAQARDGVRLQAVLEQHRPDVMQATPMTWRILFATGWAGDPGLIVSCGGDVVPPELAARLTASTKEFWHTYGPTEASMYAVCERLAREPQPSIVPVGRPLPGVAVRILDPTGAPVPPGVIGELHIGGVGVARGYVRAPGPTAERFVADTGGHGGRLYRTGDLARWLADGRLELRGRNDRQVKIRGHRIEPEEIETVLGGHPDVAFAAAVVAGQDRDSRRIVAFLQPRRPGVGSELARRVAAHARTVLPAYMVPSSYALLNAMPLTATGKIDRGALARIEPPRPDEAESGEDERWVRQAWRSVAGAHHQGDLRAAWRLRAHVRRELSVELRLGDIVAEPTAAGLAQRIRQRRLAAGTPPLRWSGRADRPALVLLQDEKAWPAPAVAEFEHWFAVAVLDVAGARAQDVPARLATIGSPGAAVLAAWGELGPAAAELAAAVRERTGAGPRVLAVEPPVPSGAPAPHWVASRDPALLRRWRATAEDAELVRLALEPGAAMDWPLLAAAVAGMC